MVSMAVVVAGVKTLRDVNFARVNVLNYQLFPGCGWVQTYVG